MEQKNLRVLSVIVIIVTNHLNISCKTRFMLRYLLWSLFILHDSTESRVKDENPVEFPMETQFEHLDQLNKTWYNLIGVVSHAGDVYSGHYTAYAKNTLTEKWYSFNDTLVHQINCPVNKPHISKKAYMLIYAKENKN